MDLIIETVKTLCFSKSISFQLLRHILLILPRSTTPLVHILLEIAFV